MLDKIPKFYLVEKNVFSLFHPIETQEVPLSAFPSQTVMAPVVQRADNFIQRTSRHPG